MFILNLGHSFTCSAVLSVCVQIPFVGHLRALYNLYLIVYGPTFNSLAELTVVHPTSVPSPQVCAIFWSQLFTVLKSLFFNRFTYLLSNSTTCLCILNCTIAQLNFHNIFHTLATLATYIIWTVLNGTKVATIDGFLCNLLH